MLSYDQTKALEEAFHDKAPPLIKAFESVAEQMKADLATKFDIATIHTEITKVNGRIDTLEANMLAMETRLTVKLGAIMAAGIAVLAALVKLL